MACLTADVALLHFSASFCYIFRPSAGRGMCIVVSHRQANLILFEILLGQRAEAQALANLKLFHIWWQKERAQKVVDNYFEDRL